MTNLNTANINELNQRYAIAENERQLVFKTGKGGLPVVEIQNQLATAVIGLQGAHLLSWIPKGQEEVIWLSEAATFAPGKSVRGGIPVCWPWFGAHESNPTFPAHGFARTTMWTVADVFSLESGEIQVSFELNTKVLDAPLQKMWPQRTRLAYSITIGRSLSLELTTFNNSEETITIGQALHTYFNVGDVTRTTVIGLDGKEYLDKPDGFKRKKQSGPVRIENEVDRVYLQTPDDVVINNGVRKIRISKQGSYSTIVWNPWQAVAEKMGDLGKEGYLKMLCVESANAADDIVKIMPGEQHRLGICYVIGN